MLPSIVPPQQPQLQSTPQLPPTESPSVLLQLPYHQTSQEVQIRRTHRPLTTIQRTSDILTPQSTKQQSQQQTHPESMHHSINLINYPIKPIPSDLSAKIPKDQSNLVPHRSQINKRKYSTAIDSRNYLTVFEYKINDSWVIWDYYTGLVHLTGLWKAIGNSKADIVKLIESSPELEPELKRVRGGFLKIQGTWISFNIAKQLASKFCYKIRYALIPIFGETFIYECLKPYEKGFGMLRLKVNDEELKKKRTRKRSKSTGSSVGGMNNTDLTKLELNMGQSLLTPVQSSVPSYHYHSEQQLHNPNERSRQSSVSSSLTLQFNSNQPNRQPASLYSIPVDQQSYHKSSTDLSSIQMVTSASSERKSQAMTKNNNFNNNSNTRNDGLLSVLKAAQDLDNLSSNNNFKMGSATSSSTSLSSPSESNSLSNSNISSVSSTSSYSALYSSNAHDLPISPLATLTSQPAKYMPTFSSSYQYSPQRYEQLSLSPKGSIPISQPQSLSSGLLSLSGILSSSNTTSSTSSSTNFGGYPPLAPQLSLSNTNSGLRNFANQTPPKLGVSSLRSDQTLSNTNYNHSSNRLELPTLHTYQHHQQQRYYQDRPNGGHGVPLSTGVVASTSAATSTITSEQDTLDIKRRMSIHDLLM